MTNTATALATALATKLGRTAAARSFRAYRESESFDYTSKKNHRGRVFDSNRDTYWLVAAGLGADRRSPARKTFEDVYEKVYDFTYRELVDAARETAAA